MKKIILSLFLFLIIFLLKPQSIFADCVNKGILGCDSNHTNACGNGSTCCFASNECGQYPAPQPQSGCRVSSIQGQCGKGEIQCGLNGVTNCCTQLGGGCAQLKGSVQAPIPPVPGWVNTINNIGNKGNTSNPMTGCGNNSINTAIGCIPVSDTNSFMGWILGWAVGVGGGIAFLLIVYASFMVMTSQGDPARLKAGQELLTSAISGLIMLIFSVFILKFIGIDILGLDKL